MRYSRIDYENFLKKELETIIEDYSRLVTTKAATLKDKGDVFVGRFIKMQGDGLAMFKVRVSDNMPRKNSFWTAVYFIGDKGSYKNWGDLSWAELRKQFQKKFSEVSCMWISKSDDPNFCLVGIKGITLDFAELFKNDNPIIAFGPQDPPIQYLMNLISIVKDESNTLLSRILDYSEQATSIWNPQLINKDADLVSTILGLSDQNEFVIQGPPGTGKTYRMAQLAAKLLSDGKSVLVTSLTNRALMELAGKEDLNVYIGHGKVSKTSLTIDEQREISNLQRVKDNLCNAAKGFLTLGTFYVTSGWAKEATEVPFDYVIMDEASQALFPMIAAILKLGKKIIWIGDQKQLAPIVITNEDVIKRFQWSNIVKGFNTLCDNFQFPSFILSDTFRLPERAVNCTRIFYDGKLNSVKNTIDQHTPIVLPEINANGGPTIVSSDLQVGEKTSQTINSTVLSIVFRILQQAPKAEIAVLAKFKDTVKGLQKYFAINDLGEKNNIKIETVDRIQGLTVDYCVYVIPNASVRYSTQLELFNVATSRARYNTIILADKQLLSKDMPEDVRKYLLKAQEDKAIVFNDENVVQKVAAGNVGVTVLGKINLPEKHFKEIVEDKENIFVIDTNVFVKCPSIISRVGKYKVVIPTTVLEELDHLKMKPNIDKKALSDAAKNINLAFQKQYSHMEAGDSSLLPDGFDSKKADCLILSVALKYKNEGKNAILLTSDQLLQSKALGLGITTISLSDFLKERRN